MLFRKRSTHKRLQHMHRLFRFQKYHPEYILRTDKLWKVMHLQSARNELIPHCVYNRGTYVVHKSDTLDIHMFPIKRILQQFDDIISDGVPGRKPFCPGQDFPGIQSSLFYWEGERETQVDDIGRVASSLSWGAIVNSCLGGQERID